MKVLNLLAVAALCTACGKGPGADNTAASGATVTDSAAAESAVPDSKPDLREVTIPAGTTLRLKLQSAVASDTSQVEDTVRAELRQAVSIDGKPVRQRAPKSWAT